ncbi:MAG: stage V sporulation protein T [Clostridia bacterium]|nr:stage V sporulation protein T [Clostridia bacterium]
MKATGIVRRIDDLGRVVIPKEIRRVLRIREGDPLEIFTERDGEVIFKKYSPIGELGDFATDYVETLSKTSGTAAVITDKDNVIAVSGVPRRELAEKRVSPALEKLMETKTSFIMKTGDELLPVIDGGDRYMAGVVHPIISEGDTIGSVILLNENGTMGEIHDKLAQSAAGFLGKHMEN